MTEPLLFYDVKDAYYKRRNMMKKTLKKLVSMIAVMAMVFSLTACGDGISKEQAEMTNEALDNASVVVIVYGSDHENTSFSGAMYTFYTRPDSERLLVNCQMGPDNTSKGLTDRAYNFEDKTNFDGLIEVLKNSKPLACERDKEAEKKSTEDPYIVIGSFTGNSYRIEDAETKWIKIKDDSELTEYLKKVYDQCQ